jgi:hypothetical protein
VVDADRGRFHLEVGDAETIDDILPHRMTGLGAEPLDAARGIVGVEGGQVHQGDGLQQPGGLPVLLHRAAGRQRRGAALECRTVHAHAFDPIKIEREAGIAAMGASGRPGGVFRLYRGRRLGPGRLIDDAQFH